MTNRNALQRLHGIQQVLLCINQSLDNFTVKDKPMLDPTIAAVIAQIDTATNAIASRIQRLIDAATSAGQLSAAEVVAALQPEVDRLTAMGKDPVNPTPEPVG